MDDSTPVEEVDEVTRLKRDIRSLKMKNEDLVDELANCQDDLVAYQRTLREISSLRKPFSHPPPEILQMIFERTIPPNFLVDSSLSFLPNSLWCQVQEQKHALLNVCRTWYIIGLPFLYTDISIRRIYQLLNLLQTLKTSSLNLNLKEMIKTIEILCRVPTSYGQQFERQLRVLFDICPRISSCSFVEVQVPPFGFPPAILLCALVPNVTNLELSNGIEFDTLQDILQLTAPHVLSLSFYVPNTTPDNLIGIFDVDFYHLENLSLWAGGAVDVFIHHWKMPRLKRLTFDGGFAKGHLKKFCDVHGASLQYLHLTRRTFQLWLRSGIEPAEFTNCSEHIPDLSNSCPALEHIVLPPFCGSLTHKGVKWVDVWVSDKSFGEVEAVRSGIQGSSLPALKGLRILPHSPSEDRHNLPLKFPPTLVLTPTDVFTFQFSDVVIRHDVGQICYSMPPRAGDLDNDEWEALQDRDFFDEDYTDEETDENSDESGSDGPFIPDDSDSDEGDYSDGSTDWEVADQPQVIIGDWELEDGPETDSLRLDRE